MRDWTYIGDCNADSLEAKIREEIIQDLANKWNRLNKSIERQHFIRDSYDYDNKDDCREEELKEAYENAYEAAIDKGASKEEAMEVGLEAKYKLQEKYDEEDSLPYKKLQILEDMLGQLGARMMRPYEHWNEDEAYMEYMENRYTNYDEY